MEKGFYHQCADHCIYGRCNGTRARFVQWSGISVGELDACLEEL